MLGEIWEDEEKESLSKLYFFVMKSLNSLWPRLLKNKHMLYICTFQ